MTEEEKLLKLLKNKKKRENFKRYLEKEHSQENLLFWIQAENLYKDYKYLSREECLLKSAEIIATFIIPHSSNEVNVPHDIKKNIVQNMLYYLDDFKTQIPAYHKIKQSLEHIQLESR